MKNRKKIIALFMSSILILTMVGCSRTVTGSKEADNALKVFNEMVKTYPDNKGFHKALQHWGFKLPGGEKFEWTKDTSANVADFAMVMFADPLIKAGLDVEKLDKDAWLYKPAEVEDGVQLANRLIKPYNVSDKKETSSGSEDALRRILKQKPDVVKYNTEEKHYLFQLGEGYEVHFAEKLGASEGDMEFVLKAEPLIKAGLDVQKLEGTGWKLELAGKDNMGSKEDQLVKNFKFK